MKEIRTAQELLESMTPGGSEFASDPEACAKYVRGRIASLEGNIKQLVRQRNEVTQKLYHFLDLLAGAVPLLELAAELIARLRCHNCPVRSRCPRFDSTTTTTASDWPCTTIPAQLRELVQGLRAAGMEENCDT